MKISEKLAWWSFLIIFLISGLIRFGQVKENNTFFTFDQARDMLDIRVLGGFHDLTVFGPTTSINGLRLGPFYYYFNLPAYWLGGGDPQALVYWNIIWFLIGGWVIFWFFRKRNLRLGWLAGVVYLMSPQLFDVTRYFWNANAAVYLSVFFFLALWKFWEDKSKKTILILGFTSGMLSQFEAAFGIVALAYGFCLVLMTKSWKKVGYFILGTIPWFIPQLLLEIKNKFQMTRLLLGMMDGSNPVLGDKLTIGQSVASHFESMIGYFEGQMILPYGWGLLFILVTLILLVWFRKRGGDALGYFIGFWIFGLIFYSLIYHHPLKEWYLESLRVWYCFVLAMVWVKLFDKKFWWILVLLFLGHNIWLSVKDQQQFLGRKTTDDPKNLANLIYNIEWIYKNMENEGFRAYSYVPEIYDYSNQYLFWWYGKKEFGYVPEIISYSFEEVPQYLRDDAEFKKEAKKSGGEKIALVYEMKDGYLGWLAQFEEYCVIKNEVTQWRTGLEIREKCR